MSQFILFFLTRVFVAFLCKRWYTPFIEGMYFKEHIMNKKSSFWKRGLLIASSVIGMGASPMAQANEAPESIPKQTLKINDVKNAELSVEEKINSLVNNVQGDEVEKNNFKGYFNGLAETKIGKELILNMPTDVKFIKGKESYVFAASYNMEKKEITLNNPTEKENKNTVHFMISLGHEMRHAEQDKKSFLKLILPIRKTNLLLINYVN